MNNIDHPHEENDCQICSLIETTIRPVIEFQIRKKLAEDLERQATYAMISSEYNFNDTAVRAKTYHHAAEIVRGRSLDE